MSDLGTRDGLPDALRILVTSYPREIWTEHPNFDGLTKFWLSRHQEFRRALAMMQSDVHADLDRSEPQTMPHLFGVAQFFLQALHGHHQIEDHQYFPIFTTTEPRLAAGFELLDADHHALHDHLDRMEQGFVTLAGLLNTGADHRDQLGAVEAHLSLFEGFLNRHLLDEEDLIVPIILHHGSPHV